MSVRTPATPMCSWVSAGHLGKLQDNISIRSRLLKACFQIRRFTVYTRASLNNEATCVWNQFAGREDEGESAVCACVMRGSEGHSQANWLRERSIAGEVSCSSGWCCLCVSWPGWVSARLEMVSS
jgi:hypothetical protein